MTPLDIALAYMRTGLSVIPVRTDGSKAPSIRWSDYQRRRPTEKEVRAWWSRTRGIAILGGEVSGGLEVIDFETLAAFESWFSLAREYVPALEKDRLPIVATPGGGRHVYFRTRRPAGNQKLAMLPPPDREKPPGDDNKPETLIETRGIGGYVIAPGSPPACHETGKTYTQIAGPPLGKVPLISGDHRELMLAAARSLNQWASPADEVVPAPSDGRRPGDQFNARAAWEEILKPRGWNVHHRQGDTTFWTRPGKATSIGYSATTGFCRGKDGRDLLYVFSSNAEPLSMGKAYSRFSAFAMLNHGGDFSAAAKALASKGYADPPRQSSSEAPDLSVLDDLPDRAKDSSAALDEPGVIDAMAWLFAREPGKYDNVKRKLRKADVGTQAYEPRVREAARKYRKQTRSIDELPQAPDDKFGPFSQWISIEGGYEVASAKTFRIYHDRSGNEIKDRIANFAARVVEETALDDGAEVVRFFTIEGMLYNGVRLAPDRVVVTKFHGMNWPTEIWGLGPSIVAGLSAKDHMRVAIEEFSGLGVPRRTVFIHLGWRKIAPMGWVYLNAGGAVCGEGLSVDVEAELQRYSLPSEPRNAVEAMKLSLSLLSLGDSRITFPLWAAVWRAPLCEWLPFLAVIWLLGETGTLKSTIAAVMLSHFGGPFDKDSLPASWLDTENRLEQKAFLAKDAPLIVDDFCPEKHAGLAQELERRASRLIRAVGNRQARGRLRSDLSARKSYFPRGIIIATAEQIPNLATSALARILPIPFERGAIDKGKLTEIQHQAQLLPHALLGYLKEVGRRGDELREDLRNRFEELRSKARVEGYDRLPEAVAHLYIGLEMGVTYAVKIGAVDEAKAKEILSQGWDVFIRLAQEHGKVLQDERPTMVFIQALQEALSSGRAWLAHRKTGKVAAGVSGPGSEKIGWVDDGGIYLLPGTSYALASERLRHRGGVSIGERALREMLFKDRLLLKAEEGRLTSKPRCEGIPTTTLHLRRDALGELPKPSARHTNCHQCGASVSGDEDEKCSTCGWLVCSSCGACKAGCRGGRS